MAYTDYTPAQVAEFIRNNPDTWQQAVTPYGVDPATVLQYAASASQPQSAPVQSPQSAPVQPPAVPPAVPQPASDTPAWRNYTPQQVAGYITANPYTWQQAFAPYGVDPSEVQQYAGLSSSPRASVNTRTPSDPYQAAMEMMRLSTQLNRYNQYTPSGSSSWAQDANGNWTQTQQLSPGQQGLYDSNLQLSQGLLGGLNSNLEGVTSALMPIDQSTLPQMPQNAGTTTQGALMSRLEPVWNRQHNQLNTQLANQGIGLGSEAWANAQDDFNRGQNDAYIQAGLHGVTTDMNARNQAVSQNIALQNQPINAFNALRTGNQAATPTFSNNSNIAPADLSGAWNSQTNYNLGQQNLNTAQRNATTSGLFGLGAAGISAYPWGS